MCHFGIFKLIFNYKILTENISVNFELFIKNDGLKKLALMRLKSASFSLLIYLFNEVASGVDEIISSKKELSWLLGWTEKQIIEALDELQFCNTLQVTEGPGKPLRLRPQLNVELWNTLQSDASDGKKPSLGDATNLHSLHPSDVPPQRNNMTLIDMQTFDEPIPFRKSFRPESSPLKNNQEEFAYQESTLNDLGAFREKNEAIDAKIKQLASHEIEKIRHEKRSVTTDEDLLLQILVKHHQPRKQLILALRSNLIYPNLKSFLCSAQIFAEISEQNKK